MVGLHMGLPVSKPSLQFHFAAINQGVPLVFSHAWHSG